MGPDLVVILGRGSAELLRVLKGFTLPRILRNAIIGEGCKKDERDMQDACGNNAYRHLVKETSKATLLQICDVRVGGSF
jgi:hypothetical protein